MRLVAAVRVRAAVVAAAVGGRVFLEGGFGESIGKEVDSCCVFIFQLCSADGSA